MFFYGRYIRIKMKKFILVVFLIAYSYSYGEACYSVGDGGYYSPSPAFQYYRPAPFQNLAPPKQPLYNQPIPPSPKN